MSEKRNAILVVGLVAGVTILTAIVGAVLFDLPKYYRLMNEGVPTTGKVVSKQPEDHMSIEYEYKVGNQVFISKGRAGDIDRDFKLIRVSQDVPVVYDSRTPARSTMGDPKIRLYSSLRSVFFLSCIPILAFLAYSVKRRFFRHKPSS